MQTFEEWALENGYPYLGEDSQGRAAQQGYRAHDEDLAAKDRRIAELEARIDAVLALIRKLIEHRGIVTMHEQSNFLDELINEGQELLAALGESERKAGT